MSYEGYRNYKCSCGTVDSCDCNDNLVRCSFCGGTFVAIQSVDCTNGYEPGPWRDVEFRHQFKDYVAKGLYSEAERGVSPLPEPERTLK